METKFQDIFKNKNQGNLVQVPTPKQEEPKQSQEQKKEPTNQQAVSEDGINKLIDAFTKNPTTILLGLGAAWCIYSLFASTKKLEEENKKLKGDFRSLKNETHSKITNLRRESNRVRSKRIEDVFDVTDVEAYEIKTDEKPEAEMELMPSSPLINPFLA